MGRKSKKEKRAFKILAAQKRQHPFMLHLPVVVLKLKAVDGLRSDRQVLAGILKNLEAAIDRLGLTVMKASAKGVQHVAFVTYAGG